MEPNYKEDIIATRIGGLGSSDARMVAKVGRTGNIDYAASERIGQMLGQVERKQVKTKAMILGDNMENTIFDILRKKYPEAVSNPKVVDPQLSDRYGFDILTHIDYEVETEGELIWFECKATNKSTAETEQTYKEQLAWHQMLGGRKADSLGKVFSLHLVHYDTADYDGTFQPEKLTIRKEPDWLQGTIAEIGVGLGIISDAVKDGFVFVPKSVLVCGSLPEKQQRAVMRFWELKDWVERYEENMRRSFLAMLEGEDGHDKLIFDFMTVTLRKESSRRDFDKARFQKEHPDLYENYIKTTKISSGVVIKHIPNNQNHNGTDKKQCTCCCAGE